VIDFDYDLEEIVTYGGKPMSLRTAIRQWKALPREQQGLADFFRDKGKEPSIFEFAHIKKLAKLPEFEGDERAE
jgi:hypothetical protein